MEASVTLKKVGKLVRDKTILAGLTFGVEKGSIVAFVGDNDAGKWRVSGPPTIAVSGEDIDVAVSPLRKRPPCPLRKFGDDLNRVNLARNLRKNCCLVA